MAGPFIPAGGTSLPFGRSAFGGAHDPAMGAMLYRLIFGPTSRPGDGSAHATAESFNPTNRSGFVNALSMLFGGGGKFDASPEMEGLGMPGQFEEYSPTKANLGGKLGSTHEGQPHQLNYSIRAANKGLPEGRYGDWAKFVHDSLFGGEAHLKGPVPKAGSPHEFSFRQKEQQQALNDHQALQELLAKSEEHQAKQEAIARVLRNHGFEMNPQRVSGKLAGFRSHPTEAAHYFHGEESQFVTPREVHDHPETLDQLTGGHPLRANPARRQALQKLLQAAMSHHHLN